MSGSVGWLVGLNGLFVAGFHDYPKTKKEGGLWQYEYEYSIKATSKYI